MRDKEKARAWTQVWVAKRRQRAMDFLGGRCIRCGSTNGLRFEYINPETQSYRIGRNLNRRWEVLVEELVKCQLLCNHCHLDNRRTEGKRRGRYPLENVLVSSGWTRPQRLKVRLIRAGLKEDRCERCGITDWRGEPITLVLHHANGIGDDDRLENLEVLCPNCHSQTPNFAGRNAGQYRGRPKRGELLQKVDSSPRAPFGP